MNCDSDRSCAGMLDSADMVVVGMSRRGSPPGGFLQTCWVPVQVVSGESRS